jgi:hypothetical protein
MICVGILSYFALYCHVTPKEIKEHILLPLYLEFRKENKQGKKK